MTNRTTWRVTAFGAAGFLAASLICAPVMGAAALAAEPSAPAPAPDTSPTQETTTTTTGNQSYELKDDAESPPVNYRSGEDARYDTPGQRDAEMYAEQYEKQRREKQVKDRKLLDSLDTLKPGTGKYNGADEGFPSRSPY